MTARTEDLDGLPNWPRLLSREQAAAYLGVAPSTFDQLGFEPIEIGRRKLFDRNALDGWVDANGSYQQGSAFDAALGRMGDGDQGARN